MSISSPTLDNVDTPRPLTSSWRIAGWICGGVIACSVVACLVMAAMRSNGLVTVTVTALDQAAEPRDRVIPLVNKKHEALPDYEVVVNLNDGQTIRLGAKPNSSAVDGLTWQLSNPVSVAEVASLRLQDQDALVSDTLAEVQITGDWAVQENYRFDFTLQRSLSVGIQSFFHTLIGKAIVAGFFVAILLMVLSVWMP